MLLSQHQPRRQALNRRFDEAFRPLGISSAQFSVMVLIGDDRRLSVGQLASRLGCDRTTVTALLKPLLRKSLAEISVDSRDSRRRNVVLAEAGAVVLRQALPIWRQLTARMGETVASSEQDLIAVLRGFSAGRRGS